MTTFYEENFIQINNYLDTVKKVQKSISKKIFFESFIGHNFETALPRKKAVLYYIKNI